jgi:hypothetical protein
MKQWQHIAHLRVSSYQKDGDRGTINDLIYQPLLAMSDAAQFFIKFWDPLPSWERWRCGWLELRDVP